jgi:DNA-binding MarR family transcriptional regulator
MGKSASTDALIGSIYAMCWRMVYLGVHKYDSNSTGELLTVMTIVLLDKAGYNPTISELAELTSLAQSNVQRYVSRQIKIGFLTDVINTDGDRRQRRLRLTSKGKTEEEWHQQQTLEISRLSSEALLGSGNSKDPVSDLRKILLGVNGQLTLENAGNYQLDVTEKKHYVHVKFEGDLTVGNEKQVINDIYSTVVQSGKKNALVDRQAGHLRSSALSSYEEGKFISELPEIHRYRFAVLFWPEDIGRASLLRAVGTDRGVDWRFFQSEKDAVRWLVT